MTRLKLTAIVVFVLNMIITNHTHASVQSFTKEADGVSFKLNKGLMKLKVCTDNIL